MTEEMYNDAMIEAFIDKEDVLPWYKNAFSKFNVDGVNRLKWQWSWWAFGGGFLYLLYRKAYIPALIFFILSMTVGMIPFASFAIMMLGGGFAPYFVYKKFQDKRQEIEANIEDKEARIDAMRKVGGYHQWVIWIYGIFIFLVFAFMASMVMVGSTLG